MDRRIRFVKNRMGLNNIVDLYFIIVSVCKKLNDVNWKEVLEGAGKGFACWRVRGAGALELWAVSGSELLLLFNLHDQRMLISEIYC